MNREKALEILGIANDLSNPDIVYQVKQQLKGLHNDNTGKLSEKIEACKLLTESQPEVFSNFVISVIKDNKPDFLELLLKTVKNDDKFNYLNTESADGETPLSFVLGNDKWSTEVKVVNLRWNMVLALIQEIREASQYSIIFSMVMVILIAMKV
ncbi:MAG: hypothetical protein ACR5K6_04290 [Wolbachia sp.]